MLDNGICYAIKKGHLQEWNEFMPIVKSTHVEWAGHIKE